MSHSFGGLQVKSSTPIKSENPQPSKSDILNILTTFMRESQIKQSETHQVKQLVKTLSPKKSLHNLIKASLSDYPKLPGKIWENSKARFIAIVRSHSLYECLSSKFAPSSIQEHEEHLNNCRFLKATIALATTDGPCTWIPDLYSDADTSSVWDHIMLWNEGKGSEESQYSSKAMDEITLTKFTKMSNRGFNKFVN